ncbi:hypothetical protein JCGZ_01868 [Jatropha curcas]|uniref:C3H1-type domain-containing protein n=1 Tax=Jatropha curcas TaxID=180498 RepID=A0A067LC60_JATCU|nr:zinc finger CCCH domain-containing protein 48 [Jatropha curcas]KDP42080.1 hypothetical protein JCGZ_01868 [Jatropha curcas]
MDILVRTIDNPKPSFYDSSVGAKKPNNFYDSSVGAKKPNSQATKLCKFWAKGRCAFGSNCKFLHSWYLSGNGFSMLARLQGHKKAVVGIALPSGSDQLYTGSRDGTVRVWDCKSGNCNHVINLGFEIYSFICEGSWVFIGLSNSVRVWSLSESDIKEFSLDGPVGRVYALAVYKDMLFAGAANGDILVWKGSFEENPFKLVANIRAHKMPITCLNIGFNGKFLYSGSMDSTVKVWDLETLQCNQILEGHNDVVMSLLSWDNCLLTCSLDHTVKFWVIKEGEGKLLEQVHTKEEKAGVLKVIGMQDSQGKPVVLCSGNDNCVRLYDLESFTERDAERDRIFAEQEVREIQRGPHGLFFTGDASGVVTVWIWQ